MAKVSSAAGIGRRLRPHRNYGAVALLLTVALVTGMHLLGVTSAESQIRSSELKQRATKCWQEWSVSRAWVWFALFPLLVSLMILGVTPIASASPFTASVGASPLGVALNVATNSVYVTNYGTDTVSVLDGSTCNTTTDSACTPVATSTVGNAPAGAAVDDTTNTIYVASEGTNALSVINGATCDAQVQTACGPVATQSVGAGAYQVAVGEGAIFVTSSTAHTVSVINQSTCNGANFSNCVPVTTINMGVGSNPEGLALDSSTRTLYVGNNGNSSVSLIALDNCDSTGGWQCPIVGTAQVGADPVGIALNSATDTLYVANINAATVSVLDGATCNSGVTSGCSRIGTVNVGDEPAGVAVDTLTNLVYVANVLSDTVSVIDGASCDSANQSGCSDTPPTVGVGNTPNYLAINPSTVATPDTVYVANTGSNTVSIFGEPVAPVNVSAANAGSNSAIVTWTVPNAAQFPETAYTIIPSPSCSTCSGLRAAGSSFQSTVDGLSKGVAYAFTVVATNDAGPSPSSDASNEIVPGVDQGTTEQVTQCGAISSNTTRTCIELESSDNWIQPGHSVTLSAFVCNPDGPYNFLQGPFATGSMTFYDGSQELGVQPVSSPPAEDCPLGSNADSGGEWEGLASFTTSALSPGTHEITATYGGDSNYGGSTSLQISEAVVSPPPPQPPQPPSPSHGYWLVGSDGGIFSFGSAQFYGSTGSINLQRPVVGIVPTKDDGGYWLDASDGGVFSYGDTQYYGSIPGLGLHPAGSGQPNSLNAPIVGMVPSIDDGGYFMVASDGGVFAFGDAHFAGSCPGIGGCSGAAVAVMPDASGNGYWLVTKTGSIYTFGDASYYGAPGSTGSPVTSAVRTPNGGGYWILTANGTVYNYGNAGSYGDSIGAFGGLNPATAIFTTSDGGGYWIASANGTVDQFGDAPNDGGMLGTHLNGSIIAATGF